MIVWVSFKLYPPWIFCADLYWDMSGNWINIVLKKIGETVKNCSLGSYLGKNWACVGHTQNQAQFFFGGNMENFFKNFLFYQNIISFDWVMNDFLWHTVLCDIFLPFPAETDVRRKQWIPKVYCSFLQQCSVVWE